MAKSTKKKELILPDEVVMNKIYLIRGQKVMLDRDLAELYGVETRRLNEQVKRNKDRFPKDFMFQLSSKEFENLISQFATSSWGGIRKLPFAFTEQGVAMLSSVLGSAHAIAINIEIMRTFVKVRGMAATQQELARRLGELEEKTERLAIQHDTFSRNTRVQLKQVFDALREMMTPPETAKRPIGFVLPEERKKGKPAGRR